MLFSEMSPHAHEGHVAQYQESQPASRFSRVLCLSWQFSSSWNLGTCFNVYSNCDKDMENHVQLVYRWREVTLTVHWPLASLQQNITPKRIRTSKASHLTLNFHIRIYTSIVASAFIIASGFLDITVIWKKASDKWRDTTGIVCDNLKYLLFKTF